MLRSMFARLMAVVMAAILICVLGLSALFYVSARNSRIDARMDALKLQAYDIAYLASRSVLGAGFDFGYNGANQEYIEWKANSLYEEFGAYSVVVDRVGQVTFYVTPEQLKGVPAGESDDAGESSGSSGSEGSSGDPANLPPEGTLTEEESVDLDIDRADIMDTLARVLRGEEVVRRHNSEFGPVFTVSVPWVDNGAVVGAVFVQTAAQTVYSTYQGLALKAALAALAAMALAGVSVFFITRQIVKPLRVMAEMAGELAEGRFERRVPVTGSRETRELAAAFNLMAGQLETLEQTRRDFVANVSHELRSPMTSMQGFLQGMLDGTIPASEQSKYMQIVLDETRRLSKLVGNLLNLSRMENSETQLAWSDFDVHETIRRVIIANMAQLDEKEMELSLSFDDAPLRVHADADQIEQVLINLLTNAVKYTPSGGHITIGTAQEGKTVRVTVRDDGPGIAPEDAPYIFDRFYKADKSHTVGKGTGLGLAICKRILEKHGQTIRLLPSSEGAAFEFTLESAPEE
ncbi:MAG: HAMP domain-containing histidine kinase [Clostridia bacterium]|nr:HAMP domain-containing histidine kinase [Clostridia bacterium]